MPDGGEDQVERWRDWSGLAESIICIIPQICLNGYRMWPKNAL